MSIELIVILFFVGCASGLLAGLLGVGGGLLLVPVLEYALKARGIEGNELVRYTLANSFFAIIFAGFSASLRQFRKRNFFLKPVLLTSVGAIVSAVLLAWLITHLDWYNKAMFNVVFMGMLLYVLYRMSFHRNSSFRNLSNERSDAPSFVFTGVVTGIVSALSGLGGGMAMIPLFTEYVGMPIKKATSVSIGVIPLLVLPVSVQYALANPVTQTGFFQWGYLVLPLSLPLIVGIMLTAPIGVNLASRLSAQGIRIIFSLLIVIIILRYLWDTYFHIQ